MKVRFWWDADSTPRAEVLDIEGASLVADFFASDLQGSVEATKEVLLQIGRVSSGEAPVGFTLSYNATAIEIDPEGCLIEEATSSAGVELLPARLTLSEMKALLEVWLAMLEKGPAVTQPA